MVVFSVIGFFSTLTIENTAYLGKSLITQNTTFGHNSQEATIISPDNCIAKYESYKYDYKYNQKYSLQVGFGKYSFINMDNREFDVNTDKEQIKKQHPAIIHAELDFIAAVQSVLQNKAWIKPLLQLITTYPDLIEQIAIQDLLYSLLLHDHGQKYLKFEQQSGMMLDLIELLYVKFQEYSESKLNSTMVFILLLAVELEYISRYSVEHLTVITAEFPKLLKLNPRNVALRGIQLRCLEYNWQENHHITEEELSNLLICNAILNTYNNIIDSNFRNTWIERSKARELLLRFLPAMRDYLNNPISKQRILQSLVHDLFSEECSVVTVCGEFPQYIIDLSNGNKCKINLLEGYMADMKASKRDVPPWGLESKYYPGWLNNKSVGVGYVDHEGTSFSFENYILRKHGQQTRLYYKYDNNQYVLVDCKHMPGHPLHAYNSKFDYLNNTGLFASPQNLLLHNFLTGPKIIDSEGRKYSSKPHSLHMDVLSIKSLPIIELCAKFTPFTEMELILQDDQYVLSLFNLGCKVYFDNKLDNFVLKFSNKKYTIILNEDKDYIPGFDKYFILENKSFADGKQKMILLPNTGMIVNYIDCGLGYTGHSELLQRLKICKLSRNNERIVPEIINPLMEKLRNNPESVLRGIQDPMCMKLITIDSKNNKLVLDDEYDLLYIVYLTKLSCSYSYAYSLLHELMQRLLQRKADISKPQNTTWLFGILVAHDANFVGFNSVETAKFGYQRLNAECAALRMLAISCLCMLPKEKINFNVNTLQMRIKEYFILLPNIPMDMRLDKEWLAKIIKYFPLNKEDVLLQNDGEMPGHKAKKFKII